MRKDRREAPFVDGNASGSEDGGDCLGRWIVLAAQAR
jgi:hypothetical protein